MSVKTGVASAAAAFILTKLKNVDIRDEDRFAVVAAAFVLGWAGEDFLKLLAKE